MLENMRKQGASLFIWLIFGILIAVFVINFGPQSPQAKQGCKGGGKRTFLTVGDQTVDDVGFRWCRAGCRPGSAARRDHRHPRAFRSGQRAALARRP